MSASPDSSSEIISTIHESVFSSLKVARKPHYASSWNENNLKQLLCRTEELRLQTSNKNAAETFEDLPVLPRPERVQFTGTAHGNDQK